MIVITVATVLGRNLAIFNQSLLIFEKLKVAMVFALKLKLSKPLRGLVYFVPYLYGGRSPPITAIQNTQAPSEFLTTSILKQKP